MKTNLNRALASALPIILGVGLAGLASAAKPPKPPPPEPGTILAGASTGTTSGYFLMSPTGGGADLTPAPEWWHGEFGQVWRGGASDPNERWFLHFEEAEGSYPVIDPVLDPYYIENPEMIWTRPHLVLVARRVSDGCRVVLNADPLLEPCCINPVYPAYSALEKDTEREAWANPRFLGTSHISWVARRWASEDPGNPIEGSPGIYLAALTFDPAGILTGAEAPQQLPVPSEIKLVSRANIGDSAIVYGCDWDCRANAAGQVSVRLAYSTRDPIASNRLLRLADCTAWMAGVGVPVVTSFPAPAGSLGWSNPRWAPDGSSFAVGSGSGIGLVDPVTGGLTVVATVGAGSYCGWPRWSPGGTALVSGCQIKTGGNKSMTYLRDIYQVIVATAKVSNLTGSTSANVVHPQWEVYE